MLTRTKKKQRTTLPPATQPFWHKLLPGLIVIAGLVAYHNSFPGVFVLDDKKHVLQSPRIRSLSHPFTIITESRRPVVDLTLAANYAIGRYETAGYHAVNLAVHILAALALFGVVRRTLLWPRLGSRWNEASSWLALTTALLWLVHPLNTQSVTYVIQRCESMMGLFYLLTLYCVIRGAGGPRPGLWYASAVVCSALGMGSKAVMVTAPLVVLLYDRVFIAESIKDLLRQRWGLYVGLAATWSALVFCGEVGGVLFPGDRSATVGFGTKEFTPLEYAATQPGVILHYLRLSLWPHPLCLDYSWPAADTAGRIVPPALGVLALLAATAAALKRKPPVGFLGAWFFLILVPTSSFIPIKDPAFEHRMYLPLAAVVALVVWAGHAGLRLAADRLSWRGRVRGGVGAGLVAAVAIAAAGATVRRNQTYHSLGAIWNDVLAQYPNSSRAQVNLGSALVDQGTTGAAAEAQERYEAAVRLDPNNFTAHYNLGNAEFRKGNHEAAILHYQRSVKIQPDFTDAHVTWAMSLDNLGRTEEAIERFRIALKTKPEGSRSKPIEEAHFNLGNALYRTGRIEEAAEQYRAVLRTRPGHIEARLNLAHMMWQLGRPQEAEQEFRQVLRLRPNNTKAREALDALLGMENGESENGERGEGRAKRK